MLMNETLTLFVSAHHGEDTQKTSINVQVLPMMTLSRSPNNKREKALGKSLD